MMAIKSVTFQESVAIAIKQILLAILTLKCDVWLFVGTASTMKYQHNPIVKDYNAALAFSVSSTKPQRNIKLIATLSQVI